MFSVVEVGGHQYKMTPGKVVDVDKLEAEVGTIVHFDQVLLVSGEKTLVGLPHVAGAKVTAKVILQKRDRKVLVFKRAPGKWRRRRGHRQCLTALLITSVEDGQGNKVEIDAKSKLAEKHLA